MMITVMMTMMGHGYDEDPSLFHIRFKSPARADWRCRGCVVIIIIMTVGDAVQLKGSAALGGSP